MNFNLQSVCQKFCLEGTFQKAEPYGTGHIHDTFSVTYNGKSPTIRYILQRINHHVFPNPPKMMENIVRVTEHIRKKLQKKGENEIDRRVLKVIPTQDGKTFYHDSENNYWRIYLFITHSSSFDTLTNLDQAFVVSKAFGNFQSQLRDLPHPPLFDTIPNFHSGTTRYEAFRKALEKDSFNRAKEAKAEIDFLQQHSWIFDVLPKLVKEGKIPIRITHNDTKINNVLLDNQTGQAMCVIDLDTVMAGLSVYDFGDIVRTSSCLAPEDEQDLSKVKVELPRLEAIVKGFLTSAGSFLNPCEKEHLLFGGKMITLMIGTRFLTDFLENDHYFKIHRPGHNLDRSRVQFQLVRSLIENEKKVDPSLFTVSHSS